MNQPKYLNPKQLAERLGVTYWTLANWRWRGVGPQFRKFGGKVMYELSDVEAWEESRKRTTSRRAG